MPESPIEEALRRAERLMELPGVVGIAQGKSGGGPCILILVAHKEERLLRQIPTSLGSFAVQVVEAGEFRALEPS